MDKIKVEICSGTACYLLGAANLMSIEDEIPAELRDKVEVEARTCLELCEKVLCPVQLARNGGAADL